MGLYSPGRQLSQGIPHPVREISDLYYGSINTPL